MRPVKKTSYAHSKAISQRFFWLLMILIAFCIAGYIFFINSAIIQIVERDRAQLQVRSLRTELLALESEYYDKTNSLTPEDALVRGLVVVPETSVQFVAVGSDGKILTYRGSR